MVNISKMTIFDYLMFLAKSLISFIMSIFREPMASVSKPEHLFALGHVIVLIGLLAPTWGSGFRYTVSAPTI